jgi:hypothetical protein
MPHERPGIESIMIIIPQDEDIVEVIEFEGLQAKSKLYCRGTDQDRHFRIFLYLDIMEVLGMLELIGAKKEFPLLFQTQPVIITHVPGYNRMIEGLPGNKFLELMSGIKMLKD